MIDSFKEIGTKKSPISKDVDCYSRHTNAKKFLYRLLFGFGGIYGFNSDRGFAYTECGNSPRNEYLNDGIISCGSGL
jgi:hypothetical protein